MCLRYDLEDLEYIERGRIISIIFQYFNNMFSFIVFMKNKKKKKLDPI